LILLARPKLKFNRGTIVLSILILALLGGVIWLVIQNYATPISSQTNEELAQTDDVQLQSTVQSSSKKTNLGNEPEKEKLPLLTIPSDFPSSLPIYPNTKIISSQSEVQEKETLFNLVTQSSADSAYVASFFSSSLSSRGWLPVSIIDQTDGGKVFTFNNQTDPGAGFISISSQNQKTIIAYSIEIKK
jgi:hypothetical protein